jgi:hypothetical protein
MKNVGRQLSVSILQKVQRVINSTMKKHKIMIIEDRQARNPDVLCKKSCRRTAK